MKRLLLLLISFIFFLSFPVIFAFDRNIQPVNFEEKDRILILAPHPDDETVGTGGIIRHALERNIPVHVAFLTNGDFNEWSFMIYRERPVIRPESVLSMGEVRHDEAVKATATLGLSEEHLSFLGYPDYGTQDIWYRHWNDSPAYKSFLTDANKVPYSNALRPGAPYKGEEILKDIKHIIKDFRPTKIFVTHPGDNHPDHRAFYLFSTVALMDLNMDIPLYPYLVHYNKWPDPRKYRPEEYLYPPPSLLDRADWMSISLSPSQKELKLEALKKHKTQYEANTDYLLSFVRPDELFGDMPLIDIRNEESHELGAHKGGAIPDELIDEERDFFTELEEISIKSERGNIIFSTTMSRPLAEAVDMSVYLFGYREDKDFSLMPKIHIKFTPLTYEVYDGYKKVSKDIIEIKKNGRHAVLSIPVSSLGEPEKIFVSAETYLSEVPLYHSPWRIIVF